jgi:GAF domain-containing protein
MVVRGKAVGVFTSEVVKVLQAIANQAALAIEHTTLIEKVT